MSFFRLRMYVCKSFYCIGGILSFFAFTGVLGSFLSLRVYFWSFLGFRGTSVIFKVSRAFWSPFDLGCIVDIFNAYGVFGSF